MVRESDLRRLAEYIVSRDAGLDAILDQFREGVGKTPAAAWTVDCLTWHVPQDGERWTVQRELLRDGAMARWAYVVKHVVGSVTISLCAFESETRARTYFERKVAEIYEG